jgi:hypothetical protein
VIAETANLRDLQPSSELLEQLNSRPWPAGTAVDSIVSNNAGRDSDDVVTVESQDLTALSQFRSLPEAKRWLQTFDRNGILHLRVHNEATTVALFTGIIGDVDDGAIARAVNRSGACPASDAYGLAAATIFRSMTFLAASITGSSVSRRAEVPFSLRNCWMNESS